MTSSGGKMRKTLKYPKTSMHYRICLTHLSEWPTDYWTHGEHHCDAIGGHVKALGGNIFLGGNLFWWKYLMLENMLVE